VSYVGDPALGGGSAARVTHRCCTRASHNGPPRPAPAEAPHHPPRPAGRSLGLAPEAAQAGVAALRGRRFHVRFSGHPDSPRHGRQGDGGGSRRPAGRQLRAVGGGANGRGRGEGTGNAGGGTRGLPQPRHRLERSRPGSTSVGGEGSRCPGDGVVPPTRPRPGPVRLRGAARRHRPTSAPRPAGTADGGACPRGQHRGQALRRGGRRARSGHGGRWNEACTDQSARRARVARLLPRDGPDSSSARC
jgi:hypothetical protein